VLKMGQVIYLSDFKSKISTTSDPQSMSRRGRIFYHIDYAEMLVRIPCEFLNDYKRFLEIRYDGIYIRLTTIEGDLFSLVPIKGYLPPALFQNYVNDALEVDWDESCSKEKEYHRQWRRLYLANNPKKQ
jgi:hypothetical protein